MNEAGGSKNRSILVPFLVGGIVGAALGVLFAPKRGSEMRRQLKDMAAGTKDKVTSTIGKGLDLYDDTKIAVTSAVQAGKQAYFQEREKFQSSPH